MNRSQAASLPTHFSRYKGLVVDDVIPTETMRLHSRLFAWSRRKHIAVKDEDAAQLNAYLINPAYLDRSVINPIVEPVPTVAGPRVVQYSQISRNMIPSKATSVFETTVLWTKQTVNRTTTKVAAFAGAVITQVRTAFHSANTYTLQHGARKAWSRRLATFATAIALLGASAAPFLIPEESTQPGGQNPTESQPVSSAPIQNSRDVAGSSALPIFASQMTSTPTSPVVQYTVPQTASPASQSAPSEAAQVAAPIITPSQQPSPIVTNEQPYQSVISPETVTPEPVAPVETVEQATEPATLLEETTYSLNETVTETTDAVGDITGSLGL